MSEYRGNVLVGKSTLAGHVSTEKKGLIHDKKLSITKFSQIRKNCKWALDLINWLLYISSTLERGDYLRGTTVLKSDEYLVSWKKTSVWNEHRPSEVFTVIDPIHDNLSSFTEYNSILSIYDLTKATDFHEINSESKKVIFPTNGESSSIRNVMQKRMLPINLAINNNGDIRPDNSSFTYYLLGEKNISSKVKIHLSNTNSIWWKRFKYNLLYFIENIDTYPLKLNSSNVEYLGYVNSIYHIAEIWGRMKNSEKPDDNVQILMIPTQQSHGTGTDFAYKIATGSNPQWSIIPRIKYDAKTMTTKRYTIFADSMQTAHIPYKFGQLPTGTGVLAWTNLLNTLEVDLIADPQTLRPSYQALIELIDTVFVQVAFTVFAHYNKNRDKNEISDKDLLDLKTGFQIAHNGKLCLKDIFPDITLVSGRTLQFEDIIKEITLIQENEQHLALHIYE